MLDLKKFADSDIDKIANLLPTDDGWDISFGADHKSIVCRHGKYSENMFVVEYDKKLKDYIFSGVNVPSTIVGKVTECLEVGEDSPKKQLEKRQ